MITRPLDGREIARGLRFPEGPVAMPDGSLLVVEIRGGTLARIEPDGATRIVAELGGGPNGAAIGPDGACYVCNNGGFDWVTDVDGRTRPNGRADRYTGGSIQRVDLATGAVQTLYTACGGEPLKGPNDLVFDSHGGFWFTDHGKTYGRLMDRGAIFYAAADGSFIKEAVFPMVTPNGVGLSPDGDMLYVSETETGRLWSFPVSGPGELAKMELSPSGGQFIGGPVGYQRFDSLAVEASGSICVATLGHGGISVFSPSGARLEFHEAPDRYCTNICFGGDDMRTAYVTLSSLGQVIAADWPRPGSPLVHQQDEIAHLATPNAHGANRELGYGPSCHLDDEQ